MLQERVVKHAPSKIWHKNAIPWWKANAMHMSGIRWCVCVCVRKYHQH